MRQIHSDLIHCVSANSGKASGRGRPVTSTPGILLAVLTADCLPIILADTKHHAVGVFHAGWRGTVKRITEKGVGEMRRHFGSRPGRPESGNRSRHSQLLLSGRHRSPRRFRIPIQLRQQPVRVTKETDEIHEKYPLFFLTSRAPGHSELPEQIFLDLAEANRRQLLDTGVLARNISEIALCTACQTDILFSHRAEHGVTGRMMAVAGVRRMTRETLR